MSRVEVSDEGGRSVVLDGTEPTAELAALASILMAAAPVRERTFGFGPATPLAACENAELSRTPAGPLPPLPPPGSPADDTRTR